MDTPALYTFQVGTSPGRPIRPDSAHVFVTVSEEDSARGAIRAACLAAQIAAGHCAMPTSTRLLSVEL